MATIKRFEDLEIWQIAHQLNKEITSLTRASSFSKDFALKDQIERSSGSVMDNIAEGFGRGSRLEFIQFLSIAKGSITETQSQLLRSHDKEYIDKASFDQAFETSQKLGNKIAALMQYLNKTSHKGQKFMNREV